jgi:hypothetical protein
LAAAYAQPSETAIENAISWAESLVGQASFPFVNGVGRCPSANWCTEFVSNAYGSVAADFNAYTLWCLSDKHPGDWNAPRGSLVFFDRSADTGVWGHVALCAGDGNVVQAGYARIKISTIRWENAAPLGGPGLRHTGPAEAATLLDDGALTWRRVPACKAATLAPKLSASSSRSPLFGSGLANHRGQLIANTPSPSMAQAPADRTGS